MDMDRYIGSLLDGRYEIMEVIGTGGMAVVYKARCHRLNRLVAVKILKDEFTQDEDFRRRFHGESQAVAALSHPNIVSVYDVSTTDDADYIVMELIDGITLKQYMEKKGVLNWKETLHFAIQIAKALDHAHSRGIVHRDIKPHNVMVLKNGSVKVADFGIAQITSKPNTMTKEALGSVHYISPEQAKGGRVDSRSDVYSLGVVMYEMMTGRPPFDGETPVAVALQHINGRAAMPSTLNPNIPGGLEQIIMKAMEKDPERRYSTATAMLYDMDEFRKDPTILFDHSRVNGEDEDVDQLIQSVKADTAVTTAEQVAAKSAERTAPPTSAPRTQPVRKKKRRKEEIVEDVDRGGQIATVTVILFSLVAIVAIALVVYALFGDGTGSFISEYAMKAPNLQNMLWENEQYSDDYTVIVDHYAYDEYFEKGHIISQDPAANTQIEIGDTIYVVVSAGPEPKIKTMDGGLIGMTGEEAIKFLTETQGMDAQYIKTEEIYSTQDVGTVVKTDPSAGEELKEDEIIKLYISKGQEPKSVTMADFISSSSMYNGDSAISWLENNGFEFTVIYEENTSVAEGKVFYQSVPPYTSVKVDTHITIKIAKGEDTTVTPPTVTMDPETYISKTVTVELPEEATESYLLSIYRETDGALMDERDIYPGTLSIQVNVSGEGIMYFLIQPSVGNSWLIQVDFSEDVDTGDIGDTGDAGEETGYGEEET